MFWLMNLICETEWTVCLSDINTSNIYQQFLLKFIPKCLTPIKLGMALRTETEDRPNSGNQ